MVWVAAKFVLVSHILIKLFSNHVQLKICDCNLDSIKMKIKFDSL